MAVVSRTTYHRIPSIPGHIRSPRVLTKQTTLRGPSADRRQVFGKGRGGCHYNVFYCYARLCLCPSQVDRPALSLRHRCSGMPRYGGEPFVRGG